MHNRDPFADSFGILGNEGDVEGISIVVRRPEFESTLTRLVKIPGELIRYGSTDVNIDHFSTNAFRLSDALELSAHF